MTEMTANAARTLTGAGNGSPSQYDRLPGKAGRGGLHSGPRTRRRDANDIGCRPRLPSAVGASFFGSGLPNATRSDYLGAWQP